MTESKTILLVEDDPDHLKVIQHSLGDYLEGITIVTASNGEEGIKAAERVDPDLIVMDIIMPDLNGMETLEAMRNISALEETPIIMLTNMEMDIHMKKADRLGVRHFLMKANTDMDAFVKLVREEMGL